MIMINKKALIEEKNDLLEKMDNIVNSAKTRTLSEDEKKNFAESELRVRAINDQISKYETERNKKMEKRGLMTEINEERILKDVVLPHERFETRTISEDEKNINLGNLIKGMAGLGWGNDIETREYYRAMQSGQNKTVIPSQLAGRIIDYARNKSAVLGNIPIVAMPNNNLTIAKQLKDAEANWVKEGELIPSTDITFDGVKLEGKTLAIFLPITEQLLESASNLENQIITSCARAIASALDKAIVYGTGEEGKIKGLTKYANINKLEYDNKNYDILIKGAREIKKANLNPTHSALNVGLACDLQTTKSADGFYIEPPKVITQLIQAESNNLEDGEGIVYDKDNLLLGIQKHITIEWGHVNDQFQRIIKGLRLVMRCDFAVLNEKAVTHIKPKQIVSKK